MRAAREAEGLRLFRQKSEHHARMNRAIREAQRHRLNPVNPFARLVGLWRSSRTETVEND